MGIVLSKLKISRDNEIIKLWMRLSNYVRICIAMITFLIARRIYNKFKFRNDKNDNIKNIFITERIYDESSKSNYRQYQSIKEIIKQQKGLKSPNKTKQLLQKNNTENKYKIIKPIKVAIKLNIPSNKTKNSNDIINKQDVEYNRSFFINDYSVNPFEKNPFKNKNKKNMTRNHNNNNNNNIQYCNYFGSAKGCKNGRMCVYSHSNPNSVPFCKWYDSRFGCKFSNKCKFKHISYTNNNTNKNKFHILPEIIFTSAHIVRNNNHSKNSSCSSSKYKFGVDVDATKCNMDEKLKESEHSQHTNNVYKNNHTSLNKDAVEFIPQINKLELENEINQCYIDDIIDSLPELLLCQQHSSITDITMPAIDENIELELLDDDNNDMNNSNKMTSKLNKNAKEFIPNDVKTNIDNYSQNYHKTWIKDLTNNPFHKNPFQHKNGDKITNIEKKIKDIKSLQEKTICTHNFKNSQIMDLRQNNTNNNVNEFLNW